jgi:hypothetical protein
MKTEDKLPCHFVNFTTLAEYLTTFQGFCMFKTGKRDGKEITKD